MQKPKAIIFDVGGVLRYSAKALHHSTKKAFESNEKEFSHLPEDLWRLRGFESCNSIENNVRIIMALGKNKKSLNEILNSENAENMLETLLKEPVDENLVKKISDEYTKNFASPEVAEMIKIYDGVKESLEKLKSNGILLGIFTNSTHATIKRDLSEIGLNNFSIILSKEDVKNKKPNPEGILLACEKLAVNPKEAVYVGDAASDIAAAKAAGCVSVALLCGMGTEKVLRAAKPDFVFADLKEMVENILED